MLQHTECSLISAYLKSELSTTHHYLIMEIPSQLMTWVNNIMLYTC